MRGVLVGLLFVSILLSPSIQVITAEQCGHTRQASADWILTMAGTPKTNIVAGIVHNLTVRMDQQWNTLTLTAKTMGAVAQANYTNNYSWTYSSGSWTDDLYGYYISADSSRFGSDFCFHVSVDSTSVTGWWVFNVYANGIWQASQQYQVITPVTGISMSSPRFYFEVIPYTSEIISSWLTTDIVNSSCVSTKNSGNVPTTLTITFDTMGSLFSATNSTGTYYPGEERSHYISFQAPAWSPREFTVKGRVHCEPQLLLTPNIVSTLVAPETVFDVVVKVARPGYNIFQMDGVVIQYKSYFSMVYRQTFSIDMYLTGNRSIYLGQDMDNLTFNHFVRQGEITEDEILMDLSESAEQQIIANITCSVAPPRLEYSLMTHAYFDIRPADGGSAGRVTSNVVVSPSGSSGDSGSLTMNIFVLVVLVVIFAAVGFFMMRAYRKTEEQKRRELEDKIRRKKEKVRKQRGS